MLSIVDLKKELGHNIYIYPIHVNSIKSNSIDLHVSKFAWSVSTKKCISDEKKEYVNIASNDTALIYTEESIYVSNCIGGSYHSKVTLVSRGAGHIGTTLDAQYVGCSLIAIHNHGQEDLKLKIGSEFVTLQFWYLHTPDYENAVSHDNEPGHTKLLGGYEGIDSYIEFRNENIWATKKAALYHKMIESDEFKKCKDEFEKEIDEFSKSKLKVRKKRYTTVIVIAVLIVIGVSIPAYLLPFEQVNTIAKGVSERFIFPILVATITAFVFSDIKDHKKK